MIKKRGSHTSHQSLRFSTFLRPGAEIVNIHSNSFRVTLGNQGDLGGVNRGNGSDTIKVDSSSQNTAVIMIGVITTQLGPSRGNDKHGIGTGSVTFKMTEKTEIPAFLDIAPHLTVKDRKIFVHSAGINRGGKVWT